MSGHIPPSYTRIRRETVRKVYLELTQIRGRFERFMDSASVGLWTLSGDKGTRGPDWQTPEPHWMIPIHNGAPGPWLKVKSTPNSGKIYTKIGVVF